jgi:cyanophycin synthetase
MRILERNVYVGPSLYAHFPVIKVVLDLGALEDWPTGKLGPDYVDVLVAALPSLAEHGCSYRTPGGFSRRMKEDDGTWLGHVFEHVAIELQNIAGEDVSFGKTRSVDDEWQWDAARDEYIRYAQRRALGPSTASPVKAAEQRNIPCLRLNEQSLIQLGHGKYQQRIQATVTGRTSYIAVELAQDKEETNKILANCGLPVPKQELVRSAERAVRAAERLVIRW